MKNLSRKRIVLQTIAVFIVSYFIFLIIWIQVKDYYGYAMTLVASKIVAWIKESEVHAIIRKNDIVQATFAFSRTDRNILVDIMLKTNVYTFNSPLTFAIIVSLSLFIRKNIRAYGEAIAILLVVHLLYVTSYEMHALMQVLVKEGFEAASMFRVFIYQFVTGFTDYMVIRFEPFLVGLYLYARFRK